MLRKSNQAKQFVAKHEKNITKGTKYILNLPKGSMLIVKERFWLISQSL
jgi:hypothetical protein